MQPSRRTSGTKQTTAVSGHQDRPRGTIEGPVEQQQRTPGLPTRHKKFMFVPASGRPEQDPDERTRRTLRAHVMHNYLEKKDVQEQGPSRVKEPAVAGGEKMRFRLTSDGLERKYPYRYDKSRVDEDRDESATAGSQTRPGSMITYHLDSRTEQEQQALELFTGTNTVPIPYNGYVQEEDIAMNDPLLAIGLGRIDPVAALPFELDPTDEALLDRFHHYERWPWCPISGQSLWGAFAMSDRLVWHATMYSWAIHFRSHFIGDARQEAAIWKHKTAAISTINARISQPEFATEDTTLAAVGAITNIELWFGNAEEAQKHMNGLHALVQLRGGINTLTNGVQKLLQRLISWNDLTLSQLYDSPMRFPPNEVWDEAWRHLGQPSLPGSPPGLAIGQLRAAGIMPHEVVSALHIMRQLCHTEMISPVALMSEHEKMMRMDALAYLERRLHILIQTSEHSIADGWNPDMWKVVSLTSAVYVSHWLRGNPLGRANFVTWTSKLHDALLKLTPGLQEMNFAPSMLLWVRAVGAIASEGGLMHDWFLDALAETCVTWGLGWDGFRWTLGGFLWIGARDDATYARLWEQVQSRIASLYHW